MGDVLVSKGSDIADFAWESSKSWLGKNAGLSLSVDTLVRLPWTSTAKSRSLMCWSTGKGPEYGGWRAFRTASSLIKTWVQSYRFSCTNGMCLMWCAVGRARMFLMCSRCFSIKISGSAGSSSSEKKSPGIRSVVPYNISETEPFMSSL